MSKRPSGYFHTGSWSSLALSVWGSLLFRRSSQPQQQTLLSVHYFLKTTATDKKTTVALFLHAVGERHIGLSILSQGWQKLCPKYATKHGLFLRLRPPIPPNLYMPPNNTLIPPQPKVLMEYGTLKASQIALKKANHRPYFWNENIFEIRSWIIQFQRTCLSLKSFVTTFKVNLKVVAKCA